MNDTDAVMTKNLTYSYISLMPKDQREAQIYYHSKLEEIGDLFPLFLFVSLAVLAKAAFDLY